MTFANEELAIPLFEIIMSLKNKIRKFGVLLKFRNYLQLIFNRTLFKQTDSVIYRIEDMEILVDHSAGDQDGTRSCLVPGLYDPCFASFINLPRTLRLLDLGANGGGFILALVKHGFRIKESVLVELNPHTWTRLLLNVYRNVPEAVKLVSVLNGGASSHNGFAEVSLGRGSVEDSLHNSSGASPTRVPTFSLDHLVNLFPSHEQIDLCKIDIEGSEYDVLEAASASTLNRINRLVIEVHTVPGKSPEALLSQLQNRGFTQIMPKFAFVEQNVFIFENTTHAI